MVSDVALPSLQPQGLQAVVQMLESGLGFRKRGLLLAEAVHNMC